MFSDVNVYLAASNEVLWILNCVDLNLNLSEDGANVASETNGTRLGNLSDVVPVTGCASG